LQRAIPHRNIRTFPDLGERALVVHLGTGINAGLYCYDPTRHYEPYALSLGAYEEGPIRGPNGEDYVRTLAEVLAEVDRILAQWPAVAAVAAADETG
jgi:hypothetical protein